MKSSLFLSKHVALQANHVLSFAIRLAFLPICLILLTSATRVNDNSPNPSSRITASVGDQMSSYSAAGRNETTKIQKTGKFAKWKEKWKARKAQSQDKKWTRKQWLLFSLSIVGGALMIIYSLALSLVGVWLTALGLGLTLFLFIIAMRAIFKPTDNIKQGVVVGLLSLLVAVVAAVAIVFKDWDPL